MTCLYIDEAKKECYFSERAKNQIEALRKNISPYEKGGIMIGTVKGNSLNIHKLYGCFKYDIASINGYERSSTKEYQKIINKEWKLSNGIMVYLGEWHTHNEDIPNPSSIDYELFEASQNWVKENYNPIMIIIGKKQNTILRKQFQEVNSEK